MAVGKQTPQTGATQCELDQQDNESCDSLVLTVSDGSARVKSELGSDDGNEALTQNEAENQGSGEDPWPATGDTPPFKEPFRSSLQGSVQSRPGFSLGHTDNPLASSQQSDKGLSAKGSRRWATLDQGTHLWAKAQNPVHVVHGVGLVTKGTKGVGLPLGQRGFGPVGKGKSLGKTLLTVGTPRRDFDQWKGAPLWFPGVGQCALALKVTASFPLGR